MSTYTIYYRNGALGTGHFCGTYATQEEAEAAARREAGRSQSFMRFEIYRGTPRAWFGVPLSTIASDAA